jgi:hypothetical protein
MEEPTRGVDGGAKAEAHKVTNDELLMIYRDLLKTSGIWQYPGLKR